MMDEKFLFEMLETPSVSGYEEVLQKKVAEHMKTHCDGVFTDEIGDVVCVLNPDSRVRVLLSAHADEIGLVVSEITPEGFLHVVRAGGIYCETYPGQKVRVLGEEGVLYGSVLENRELAKKTDLAPKDLIIDIGASDRKEARTHVAPGTPVIFDTDYRRLLGNRLTARALDDRIGVFCIMEALKLAGKKGCRAGVYCASTVGEETSKHGAYWVSSRVKPTLAVVVDVTYASDYEGMDENESGKVILGGGIALCSNPFSHKMVNKLLEEAASDLGYPWQMEVGMGKTCTDADEIHVSCEGVPTALVSIPLRYMHTPAEVCDWRDVEGCIETLAQFLCRLDGEDVDLMPFKI